ncbi:MAG: sugar-binding protein [Pseudomonas sp.]
MAAKTAVHSNAFNFLSFIDNSVDPRTGQYSLSIAIPELQGNNLIGPNLPLRLSYSSMGAGDTGYGEGWDLNLTSFIEHAYPDGGGALSLYTGERFTVDGIESISEKKLDTFHFHKDGEGRFRVVHRTGLVEVLESMGSGEKKVALPTRIYAPSGHWIDLSYVDNPQHRGAYCLREVRDGGVEGKPGRRLLLIEYPGDMIITLHPDHPAVQASYTLKFNGRQLNRVVLPTSEQAYWEFTYQVVHGQTCISQLRSPSGAVEYIDYGFEGDPGHQLPGVNRYLPRVKRHRVIPGFDQAQMHTLYDYSPENFLGNGSGITWRDNGRDNLYEVANANFKYWSKTTQQCPGQADRTVTRTYDRFHLNTEEAFAQAQHVLTITTLYHGDSAKSFKDQPDNFQLPSKTTKRWKIGDQPAQGVEEHTTDYDLFGNLVREVAATGVETVHEFYPATGEKNDDEVTCPADPYGFTCYRKSQTVKPSDKGEGKAVTLRTVFKYKALDPIPVSGGLPAFVNAYWVAPYDESLFSEEGSALTLQRQTVTDYYQLPESLIDYGRPSKTIMAMGGQDTTTRFTYSTGTVENHPVLVTVQTVEGFDHGEVLEVELEDGTIHQKTRNVEKQVTLKHSVLIGQPLLNRDDNDVEIAYAYDLLARVVRETVAPNDEKYRASCTYSYTLAVGANPAIQTKSDVKGVTTRSKLDGLGRAFEEERFDADSEEVWRHQQMRKTYSATYNAYGQLAEETEYDWLADAVDGLGVHRKVDLPLRREFGYDAWGQPAWEKGPDGVTHFEVTDPIGTTDSEYLPIKTSWREAQNGSAVSGVSVTYLNRFEEATHVLRYAKKDDETPYSKHRYYHDGLGRVAREVAADQATTRNEYDAFGRLLTQTLPDDAKVTRSYATFDSDDLPESIDVNGLVLGTQTFDGLKRLYRSVTGGRERTQYFKPGQNRPEKVFTPSKQWVDYEYNPVLGEEPFRRVSSQFSADYVYDPENARLLECSEDGQTLQREYFSTGQLKTETRLENGEQYKMSYMFSYRERMLSYTDVLGQQQSYEYDPVGRLKKTTLGTTTATFEYDAFGRTSSIRTEEGDNYLVTELEYDEYDRETLRRFDMKGDIQTLKQDYDVCDRIVEKTLMAGEQKGGELLRNETYAYEARGRLYDYNCTGPLSPVDPQGHTISAQAFEFDALDNIILVVTSLIDKNSARPGENVAEYFFENEDPAQLSSIINSYEGYTPKVVMKYDLDGNLEDDGEGMAMAYDATGRLRSVVKGGESSFYNYDAVDRLSGQS